MSALETPAETLAEQRRWKWTWSWSDFWRGLAGLFGSVLGLQMSSWLFPSLGINGWTEALNVALTITIFSIFLRPVLIWLSVRLGWVGAVLLAAFGQALLVWVSLPSSDWDGPKWQVLVSTLVASWLIAGMSTLAVWLLTAGTDEAVTASFVRKAGRRRAPQLADADVPGVLFVQADGVPFPVLELGVISGTLPTLARWVRSGSHTMAEWRPKLPATTPASQMGILHGSIEGIPAFRWLDRSTGTVLVANRPADAAAIEALHSDGCGLLADDGVSISNLFTGDAPAAYTTMSAIDRTQESIETRTAVSHFLARPEGLARGLSRTVSEVARERFQASRATRRDIQPRVHRSWTFALERAGLSGVLRDLNTSLAADAMLRGKRSIYVNYGDYDAVAHHAGVLRPEALAALEGIDAVLGQLERVAAVAPRRYHLVVLSDHGQSQGAVFAERYGEDLATVVSRLADADVATVDAMVEETGRLTSLFGGAGSEETVFGRAMDRVADHLTDDFSDPNSAAVVSPESGGGPPSTPTAQATGPSGADRFLVFGSGNLGLVYVVGQSTRLTSDEIGRRFPSLIPGLVVHPGVGFVVVTSDDHGPVAIGCEGEHRLVSGVVVGVDPLAGFGPHAREFFLRAASMPEAPDIYLNSIVDEMGEVAAFEGLVGCHGGLGGWQDRAMIVWPATLPPIDGLVVGADALHEVLVGWLEHLGQRRDLPAPTVRPYAAPPASPAP